RRLCGPRVSRTHARANPLTPCVHTNPRGLPRGLARDLRPDSLVGLRFLRTFSHLDGSQTSYLGPNGPLLLDPACVTRRRNAAIPTASSKSSTSPAPCVVHLTGLLSPVGVGVG